VLIEEKAVLLSFRGDVTSDDMRVNAALQRAESGAPGHWQKGEPMREVCP
jgi:hypothetical protein